MDPEHSLPYSHYPARYLYPKPDQSNPRLAPDLFCKSVLILSSCLRLSVTSDIFPSGFSTKILYETALFPKLATCPVHLILLDFVTRMIFRELQIMKTLVLRFPQWRSWLRHCATSQKVAGSIPDGVIGIFH